MKKILMLSNIILLLLLCLYLSPGLLAETIEGKASPGPDDAAIEKALELSGIKEQIARMQPNFPESDIYASVLDYFRKHNEEASLAAVLKWIDSGLYRKILKLELEAQTPEGIKKAGDFFEKMGSIMEIKSRIDLIKELDRLFKTSDFQIELMKTSLKAYSESVNDLLIPEERLDKEESEKIAAEKIDKQKDALQAGIIKLMIYTYNQLTDEELREYIAFMKSAPAQWFNDCYGKALIAALTESIKQNVARMAFIADGLKQLKKEFVLPDNPEWFMPYYYRNKDKERLVPSLREILSNKGSLADKGHVGYIVHFFSTAIKDDGKITEELRVIQDNYSGEEKEIIERILAEAKAYVAAGPESPEGMSLMWAEFGASGEKEIIKRVVGTLSFPEMGDSGLLVKAGQQSLLVNCIKDRKVRDSLKEMVNSLGNGQKTRVAGIISLQERFEDLSWALMQRAYSHLTLKKDEEGALKENESALLYCPDYPNVYNNISNIYEGKADKNKTLIYRKASVYLDPAYDTGYFNLGRYYFFQRDYENAIKYDLKAIEYNPAKAEYNHGLARSYQEKGDTANAVKYFKKYLEYAPNGEFVGLVRAYLASVGSPVEENASDPFVMLKNGRYDELERYFSGLLEAKQKDENGYSVFCNVYRETAWPKGSEFIADGILRLLEKWATQKPSSRFAGLCLGRFYVNYAWQARGSGFVDSVTEEGRKLFRARLEKARGYLEKAYSLDVNDPFEPIELMIVARGLGLEREEMEKQFQRAIKADSTEYRAYLGKLEYLKPKWYGTEEEMFAFARESAKNAPAGTLIPRVLIEAHLEMYLNSDNKDYFRDPQVWAEVKGIYLRLLKDFPGSFDLRNWFALTAYYAKDYLVVKEQMDLIGDKWEAGSAWKSLQDYERVKKQVNSY